MKKVQRQAVYALAGAVGALLVAVGVLDSDLLGPVLAVVAGLLAVVGSLTAARHITPDGTPADDEVAS